MDSTDDEICCCEDANAHSYSEKKRWISFISGVTLISVGTPVYVLI
jgi:hypothetical protein